MEKTETSKFKQPEQLTDIFTKNSQSVQSFIDSDLIASLFDFSNDEIIITDADFNIAARNFKIFTHKTDNVKNFLNLLEKKELFEEKRFIEKYSRTKIKKTALRLVLPDGKYLKTQLTKIFSKDIFKGYLIVLNDYTADMLHAREKEYFIDTLMHDLKTPARAEENALELLCNETLGKLNPEQKQMLKEILNSSRYMVRMTDNVLAKLRLETQGLVLKKQLNSIKKTIESCVEDMKYMLESSNQTIRITSHIENDTFVYDEETIKLVLKNLLTNACEYSPKNSTVLVAIDGNTENIIISVKDKGCGIPDEKIEVLFNNPQSCNKRFKKVSSGLGLFISKKILEAHNGTIEVKNLKDNGSEIIVKLPSL